MFKTENFLIKFRHTSPSQAPSPAKFGEVLDGQAAGYGGYLKREDYIKAQTKLGKWTNGSTVCEIYRDFNYEDPKSNVPFISDMTTCSPHDQFNRKDGRYFSLMNLLFESTLAPSEKHEVINAFFDDPRNEGSGYGKDYFVRYAFEGKMSENELTDKTVDKVADILNKYDASNPSELNRSLVSLELMKFANIMSNE